MGNDDGLPSAGMHEGHEGDRPGFLTPRQALRRIKNFVNRGVQIVTSHRPDGTTATWRIRKGPWTNFLQEMRNNSNKIETF